MPELALETKSLEFEAKYEKIKESVPIGHILIFDKKDNYSAFHNGQQSSLLICFANGISEFLCKRER